jgi:hypothetical protein
MRIITLLKKTKRKILQFNIWKFCKDTIHFLQFLYTLATSKPYRNSIKKTYSGKVIVLANGPSLKEYIPRLAIDKAFQNADFVVMNNFAFNKVFLKIKPKHYCFSDEAYIKDSFEKEKVHRVFKVLQENVDWELNIYVPGHWYYEKFIHFFKWTNAYIKIIPINYFLYKGYENLRNFFYKKSLAIPPVASVVILAIYVSINLGYSEIDLYGADHNFFDSLCVNENNVLCYKYSHFYDNDIPKIVPIIGVDFQPNMVSYLREMAVIFEGHDLLSNYAKYNNVEITNCTKDSLIDSYDRKNPEKMDG